MPREPPAAVTTRCPACGEVGAHTVLHGTMGTRGQALTIDATVQCSNCGRTHHAIVKEAKDVDLPVVVSAGGSSSRTRIRIPGDAVVRVGEDLIVDDVDCRIAGIETSNQRRVEAALANEVRALWVKRFDEVTVGFAINLDKKTIAKELVVEPTREFSVGEELVFGRLRVTIHAIKTEERLLKRGTAEAGDIVRVFARPTTLARPPPRPDKRTREQLRAKEERRAKKRRSR